MATIGIYDADFFTHGSVIPNLECMKLYSYFRDKHDIVRLISKLDIEHFTQVYARKEYDDGIYPRDLFSDKCEYGGRAFSGDRYIPFTDKIERSRPEPMIYEPYMQYYSSIPTYEQQFKHILNCAHGRLAIDNEHIDIDNILRHIDNKNTGIIIHDYNPAKLAGITDALEECAKYRKKLVANGKREFSIGNKYPFIIDNSNDFLKLLRLPLMRNIFYIQYDGPIEDEVFVELCRNYTNIMTQIIYNITAKCSNEDDFFKTDFLKIYKHILFSRSRHVKILLKDEASKINSPEMIDFLNLLNCWLGCGFFDDRMKQPHSLYAFVYNYANSFNKSTYAYTTVPFSVERAREVFSYIRNHYYELFVMLYELDIVTLEEGQFQNGRT